MSQLLAYQCPHCQHTLQVDDDVLGEEMDCPNCDSPFKVEVPSADPVDPTEVNPEAPVIHRADRKEEELENVHPVMFRKHPLRFLGEWAIVISGIVVIGLAMAGTVVLNSTAQIIFGVLLAGAGASLLTYWWLTVIYTNLSVTNQRTILRRGIISRFTTEVQHDDIRNIQVEQTVFERLVGVGDIAVSSSGQDDLEVEVEGIPRPKEFAEMIRNLQ